MRWFKHIATSHDDEKLVMLRSKYGLAGYGFWWMLLEIVANQMDKDDGSCSVTYPIIHWVRLTGTYHHRLFRDYHEFLSNLGLISVQCTNDLLTISIPNLLKYRDEYSKKSRHAPDKLPAKNIDTDTDTDKKNKTLSPSDDEGLSDFLISKKKRKLEGKRLETFKEFWESFGYKTGRAEAIDAWLDIPQLTKILVEKIIEAAKREAKNRPNITSQGRTPKMAQGWLSARRWEDEPTTAAPRKLELSI